MPCTALTHHYKTILIPMLTILEGRATLTLPTGTLLFNLKVLYSYLGSNIEPLITCPLYPHNQNPT